MKLKSIPLLLLPALLALLLACGGESQIVNTPTREANVVAEVEVEPSPTNEPSKSEPAKPSNPEPTLNETPPAAVVTTKAMEEAPTLTVTTSSGTPTQSKEGGGVETAVEEVLAEAAPNGPRGVGRLYHLPVDPYLLVAPEGMARFRGYGTANGSSEHPDVPVSVHWEFIGSPGSSVFAPATSQVMDIVSLDGGDYSVLLSGASNPFWVWELKHVEDLTVEAGDHIEATKKIGVISEAGSLLLGLKEQQDPGRERTDLPRYHCPLISLHPVGFIEVQLEMIRQADSERLGLEADLIQELSPCAVTTPLPELPNTGSDTDETQRQIDVAFAATAIWDPVPKPLPSSSFDGHVAGLAYRLPVDPEAVVAHIPTLDAHAGIGYVGQAVAEDAFHGYGFRRPFEGGMFQGFDVGWSFLAAPGTPVVAPVAGWVMRLVQIKLDEPDMTIVINQTGEMDWSWDVGHVVDVRVEVGDRVEVGETIAEVAPDWSYESEGPVLAWNAYVKISLTEYIGGEVGSLHHCPLVAINPEGFISEQLELIRQALGVHSGINPDDHPRWTICTTDQPFGGDRFSGGLGVVPDYEHMRDVP